MKLSVIVPVYNCASFLDRSIGSLLSLKGDVLEVIAVNDGSTDGSLGRLYEIASKDSRLLVIDKENGGVSSARNAGLEVASGDFIGFLDADDYYADGAITRIYDVVSGGADIDVLMYGHAERTSGDSQPVAQLPYNSPRSGQEVLARYYEIGRNGLFGSAWLAFISKPLIEHSGLRFESDMRLYEDLLFMSRVMQVSDRFKYLDEALYVYCRPKKLSYESFLSQECYVNVYRYLKEESCLKNDLVESNCVYSLTRDAAHCLTNDRSYKKFKRLLDEGFRRYGHELGRLDELKDYLPKKIYFAALVITAWGRMWGLGRDRV